MVAVPPIEREHPHRPRHCHAVRAQRPGRQVGKRKAVGGGHARDGGDPAAHLLERQQPGAIRGRRHETLAARDASAHPHRSGPHGAPGAGAVGDRHRRSRRDGADVAAQPGHALGERARALAVGQRGTVHRRRAGDVAQRRRRRVLDDDVVRRLVAAVDHSQGDGDRIAGRDRARGADALLQPEAAAERRGEHPLHVDRERCDRARRQRRARTVDEEEHAGEQADAQCHAGQRSDRPARIAYELAPHIATHCRPPARRAARAAGRAARPARGRG